MRALVTGGTGFVGSNIAKFLLKEGYEVVITGRNNEQTVPGAKLVTGELVEIDWHALGIFDVIFHEAANTDTLVHDREEQMRTNLEASKRLIEYASSSGCKRIVYASSTATYGDTPAPFKEEGPFNPLNPYGESKLLLDKWAMEFARNHPDMTLVGLRYCNVYGSGESHKGKMASMIYQLAQQMKTRNPRLFKHGEQKRDYIYVKDVVKANMLASHAKESCVVNCGSGTAVTFNRVFEIIKNLMVVDREIDYIDNPYEATYQNFTECDMTLAKKKLGFSTEFSIEEGIADYYESGKLNE